MTEEKNGKPEKIEPSVEPKEYGMHIMLPAEMQFVSTL